MELLYRPFKPFDGAEFKEATTGATTGVIPKIRFLVNGRNADFLKGFEIELKEKTSEVNLSQMTQIEIKRSDRSKDKDRGRRFESTGYNRHDKRFRV